MWLYNVPKNAELVLTVKDAYTTLDFKTVAREPIGNNGVWVDVIKTSQGKTIDFKGRVVSLALNRKGRKPIVWESITVRMFRVNGDLRQALLCDKEGVEVNRRKVYRQPIMLPAYITLNEDGMDGIIKDVGATGFSIICQADSIRHGTGIPASCRYQDGEENIYLTGKVVRVQELEDKTVCYGCKYTGRTDVMVEYVRRKKKEAQELEAKKEAQTPENKE